jgi:outer membrane biosynthesis protein TonB
MKNYTTNSDKENKNRKKGFFITMFVHLSLLGLAFFPLMSASPDMELEENTITLIDLPQMIIEEEFVVNAEDKSRKNEASEEAESVVETPKKTPSPCPEPIPTPAPVEVEESDTPVNITTVENSETSEITTNETPAVEPTPEPTPSTAKPSGATASENTSGGTTKNNTAATGDGGNDDELQEGVFGRKVMKRPNIKGLTKEKGKVAIKVCVSQQGTVIASKHLPKFSTLKDPALIAAAMKAVRYYKFDVDYSAPKTQWGKLTFIFDI